MLFMFLTLILTALGPPSPQGLPASAAAGRQPALDSLASSILAIGDIPEAPDLLILSALRGWPGRISYIAFTPGDEDPVAVFDSAGSACAWGAASGLQPGDSVLVLAPWPEVIPEGLSCSAGLSDTVRFTLRPDGSWDRAFLSSPSLQTVQMAPDTAGAFLLVPGERGVYWIEAVRDGISGPEVLMLLPLLVDVTPGEVFGRCPGVLRLEAFTLSDISRQMDSLRMEAGCGPLARDPGLDSLARIRAVEVALSGRVDHAGLLSRELPGYGTARAENVGSGEGLDEAWRMVLASPIHLAACLSPGYSRAGLGIAVAIERGGWQIVLVQIFEGDTDH
jgi:hypothetical protein